MSSDAHTSHTSHIHTSSHSHHTSITETGAEACTIADVGFFRTPFADGSIGAAIMSATAFADCSDKRPVVVDAAAPLCEASVPIPILVEGLSEFLLLRSLNDEEEGR